MKKTVVIYSTKNQAGFAPSSELVATFEDSTRKEAFAKFMSADKNRNALKWNFDKRSLIAVYRSGKRHGRERKFYYVAYMTEKEFYEKRQAERNAFRSAKGETWDEFQKRING